MKKNDQPTSQANGKPPFRWRKPKMQRLSLSLDTANSTGVYSDFSLSSDTFIGSLPPTP